MNQRTCNIIMCCKGNTEFAQFGNPVYAIKRYMGEECDYDWRKYSESHILNILLDAVEDYLDTADKPSSFIWSLRQGRKFYNNDAEIICSAFRDVSVRNEFGKYVNGFSEEVISQSRIDLRSF